MPLLLFTYFFVEVLAFLGVANLIGVGWAFLAIFGCMLLGGFVAAMSMRSMLASAAQGKESVGALAGDTALLIAGWAMCVVPGFVSTFFGLLMVLPPTRTLMRRGLTARVRRSLESFGEQLFDASPIAPKAQHRTSYGTFTPAPGQPGQPGGTTTHEVIDADELEQWYRMDGPDEDHGAGPSRGGVH